MRRVLSPERVRSGMTDDDLHEAVEQFLSAADE